MKCDRCAGIYREKTDLLEIVDPYVGRIWIRGVPYYECDRCKDILYTPDMTQAIETERDERLREFLNQLPITDFVSAAEAASILGISRQALHKNRRINNGFIYQTKFAGATVYHKQSVIRFKKTGDGRFPLYHGESKYPIYLEETIPLHLSPIYEFGQVKRTLPASFSREYFASVEDIPYGN